MPFSRRCLTNSEPRLPRRLVPCAQVFAHASVALAMANVEGRLVESNLQFEALSGYSKDELKQLTLLSLTAPSDLQETFG